MCCPIAYGPGGKLESIFDIVADNSRGYRSRFPNSILYSKPALPSSRYIPCSIHRSMWGQWGKRGPMVWKLQACTGIPLYARNAIVLFVTTIIQNCLLLASSSHMHPALGQHLQRLSIAPRADSHRAIPFLPLHAVLDPSLHANDAARQVPIERYHAASGSGGCGYPPSKAQPGC